MQEVTPLIQALLQSAPWWQQYAASPAPSGAPYYTLLLIKRSAAPGLSSSSFREVEFQNSVMGEAPAAAGLVCAECVSTLCQRACGCRRVPRACGIVAIGARAFAHARRPRPAHGDGQRGRLATAGGDDAPGEPHPS